MVRRGLLSRPILLFLLVVGVLLLSLRSLSKKYGLQPLPFSLTNAKPTSFEPRPNEVSLPAKDAFDEGADLSLSRSSDVFDTHMEANPSPRPTLAISYSLNDQTDVSTTSSRSSSAYSTPSAGTFSPWFSNPPVSATHMTEFKASLPSEPSMNSHRPYNTTKSTNETSSSILHPPCYSLPGAEDTVVVLRTGSTEMQDKLPVHFNTTLQCYPNQLIISDYELQYEGHRIIDAFEFVDHDIRALDGDFELWRRLQEKGLAALAADELSGVKTDDLAFAGKPENPGWKLDKWKFLPMLNWTLSEFPDKKWYVFVESDTFIFWGTLLEWLATLDSNEKHYLGVQVFVGDIGFAHGGSTFVISHASLRAAVDLFLKDHREWLDWTAWHTDFGDEALGKLLFDSGSPVTEAWPIFQGLKPGAVRYTAEDWGIRLWCYPSVSYHHLTAAEVDDVWRFEQEWLKNGTNLIRHREVFDYYISPKIMSTAGTKSAWDNFSGDFDENGRDADSVDDCRGICNGNGRCVQYAFSNGKCVTLEEPKWGEANERVESGWFLERVNQFAENMAWCRDEMWLR